MNLEKGGRGAIERMMEAYGFSTRQQLCEQLGVSKSTLATRYMRDSFPSDWVIQCALETGVSLRWLATGAGVMFENEESDHIIIPRKKLLDGKLYDSNHYTFDKAFLATNFKEPVVIIDEKVTYIGDTKFIDIEDGKWLIDIDGKFMIRDIALLPGKRIRVISEKTDFDCSLDDIEFHVNLNIIINNI
ncbi:phage repressor protein CI [Serratia marcescens]|uniref:phage repressor protein CI n=1 Tax=Serratia sp. CY38905 TaxID=3383613 RepID=UPI0033792572